MEESRPTEEKREERKEEHRHEEHRKEEHAHEKGFKQTALRFHDRHYKTLLIIPVIILLACVAYMFYFYSVHGDFVNRDISLTGGTSVTINNGALSVQQLQSDLAGKLDDIDVRAIYDQITQQQKAVVIETKTDANATKIILDNYLGYNLTNENSSFGFTGSSLSTSFFRQLMIAVLLAFVFMALVVFIMFRTLVPSTAVVISAFADIFMTLTLFNILGFRLSSAGIIAFLMLIGYSVDTDILLTNRVLRRHENTINRRVWNAFKTGITMSLTSLFAVLLALIVVGSFSLVLSQIFTILVIGLCFDIFNTWLTNASIIKWYAIRLERRESHEP